MIQGSAIPLHWEHTPDTTAQEWRENINEEQEVERIEEKKRRNWIMCHLRLSVMHDQYLSLHLDVPGLARLQVPGVHFTDGWGGESVTHGSPAPSKD